jgi:hypothetical protein
MAACSRCHQPVLQGVEPDEHAIGRQQQMLMPAIPCALPGGLQGVDEDELCWRACTDVVVDEGVGGESDDVAECPGVERHGGRRVKISRRRGDKREVLTRVVADRHRDARCDRQVTHGNPPFGEVRERERGAEVGGLPGHHTKAAVRLDRRAVKAVSPDRGRSDAESLDGTAASPTIAVVMTRRPRAQMGEGKCSGDA